MPFNQKEWEQAPADDWIELDEDSNLKGGPGSGRYPKGSGEQNNESKDFFHGTILTNVSSIKKEGLRASYSGQNFPGTGGGGSKPGHIYVTNDEQEAKQWAREISFQYPNFDKEGYVLPAVVHVAIPEDKIEKNLIADENLPNRPTNFQFKGNIKPEWIKGIQIANNLTLEWEPVKAKTVNFYVPILVRKEKDAVKGGPGSGRYPKGSGQPKDKAARALASHKPATREKHQIADKMEENLAKELGGTRTTNNSPFDVLKGSAAIEVKTVIDASNDKITMHPESLERKLNFAEDNGVEPHTVVIDKRGIEPAYYYRQGLGSFRLGSMEKVSLSKLRSIFA